LLRVHGSGVFVDGGSTSEHGLQIKSTTTYGTTADRTFEFSRYSPAGTTAFIEVFSGTTYGNRPFVSIKDGANRKTITTATAHGLQFGMPVRYSGTAYVAAQASDGSAAEVVGIVSAVYSSLQFEITFLGEIFGDFSVVNGGQPLIPGSTYYLSPYTAGFITSVQPTGSGLVHKAVLVATSTTSAIVLPFTGGVLSTPISIVNASSVSTTIPQYNGFTLGDMVRFKYYQNGITLYYKNDAPAGASSSQYHQYGIFVKAQANSEEEAEVAGMVVGRSGLTGTAPYTFYTSFDVLMDGFFDLSTSALNLQPGTVYFLNTGSAGSSNSFESAVVTHNTAFPTQLGQVRKPLFMATGPKSGYLFSYRGDIRAEVGITGASADITRFLVKDIRDGISGDLVVGVYNTASNGRESIRIAAGTQYFNQTVGLTGGLVGIGGGWSPYATSVAGQPSRIMAQLDVNGELRLGKTLDSSTPRGQDLIIVRDVSDNANGVTMDSRVVIGTEYSSTNLVIGRGVRPARTAAGYISSLGGVQDRAALVVGVSGADPMLRWGIAQNSSAALGTGVVLQDVLSVVGATATLTGTLVVGGTGGTGSRVIANAFNTLSYTQTDAAISARGYANSLEWGNLNVAGYACVLGSQNSNGAGFVGLHCESGTNTNTYRTRGYTGWVVLNTISGAPVNSLVFASVNDPNADNQTPSYRMVLRSDGKSGINTGSSNAPLSELHVHSSSGGINSGLYLTQGATPTVGSSDSSVWQIVPTLLSGVTALQIIDRVNSVRRAVFRTDGSVALGGPIGDDAGSSATLLLSADQKVTSGLVGELRNTISFSMVHQTGYSGQWHGCSKPANSNVITLPTGTWQGYVWSIPSGGTPVTMTTFSAISGSITVNPGTMGSGYYMNVHITRVS